MDLTMVAAKIYEPELIPNRSSIFTNDYEKVAIISQKMDHYTNMVLRATKKVYNDWVFVINM